MSSNDKVWLTAEEVAMRYGLATPATDLGEAEAVPETREVDEKSALALAVVGH